MIQDPVPNRDSVVGVDSKGNIVKRKIVAAEDQTLTVSTAEQIKRHLKKDNESNSGSS